MLERAQPQSFQKLFGGYLFVFVEYLRRRRPQNNSKKFRKLYSISIQLL